MKKIRELIAPVALLVFLFGCTLRLCAQGGGSSPTEGNVGIYNSGIYYSTASIDATPFYNDANQGHGDICSTIHFILTDGTFNYALNYPAGQTHSFSIACFSAHQSTRSCEKVLMHQIKVQ